MWQTLLNLGCRRLLQLATGKLLCGAALCVLPLTGKAELIPLTPGKQITSVIANGKTQTFTLSSIHGMFFRIHVFQTDIDVSVSLRHGAEVPVADSNQFGEESLSFIAKNDGTEELSISAARGLATSGRYVISLDTPRLPTPADLLRMEAENLVARAKAISKPRTAGALQEATGPFEAALRLYRELGDDQAELAQLISLGDLMYWQGDYNGASLRYREAIDVSNRRSNLRGRAEALNNLGGCLLRQSKLPEAALALEESLHLWEQARVLHAQVAARNGLSTVKARLGETSRAIAILQKAIADADAVDGEFRMGALTNLGLQFLSLADTDSAVKYLKQAVRLSRASGKSTIEARALLNLGRSFMLAGNSQLALPQLEAAQSVARQLGDASLINDVEVNISLVHFRRQQWQLAQQGMENGLERARMIGDKRNEGTRRHFLGAIKTAVGKSHEALSELNQALDIRRAAGYRDEVAATLFAIADAERQSGKIREAQAHAEEGLRLLESLRSQIAGERFRALYFGGRYGYAELYIDILMRLHAAEPNGGFAARALEVAERTRAGVMVESLRKVETGGKTIESPALSALLQERHLLDEKVNAALQRPGSGSSPELSELMTQFDRVEIRIAEESPRPAVDRPKALTADGIAALIRPGVSFLEYVLGDEHSYLWLVQTDGLTAYTLPNRTDIERLAHRARELIVNQPLRQADKTRDLEMNNLLHRLAGILLAPAKARIGRDRLVVVLDGALNDLPFEALPEPATSPRDGRYLPTGVVHEIVRIQSGSVLAALRDRTSLSQTGRGIVLLGDPAFQEATGTYSSKRAQREFPRLPGSADEVRQIAGIYAPSLARTFTRFDANHDTLFSRQTARASIVHIATHAFVDNSRPELSGIALASLKEDHTTRKDSFVPLRELTNLNLSADLVVLSACATATGRHIQGEGIMDISRAFFRAGAARVMATLWEIQDGGNTPYMMAFYESLRRAGNSGAARAARVARESMWKSNEWRDPWFWAAFTLSGEHESWAVTDSSGGKR